MKGTEKQKEAAAEIISEKSTVVKSESALPSSKYKLMRKKDNFVKEAKQVCYIYWKSNGTFASIGNSPNVGASLALDKEPGQNSSHTTDQITKIIEITDSCFKFETKDGLHELIIAK